MLVKYLSQAIKFRRARGYFSVIFPRGFIALPTILLIAGILLELTLAFSLISFYLVQISSGRSFSASALAAARTGVDDAIIKVIRNKDFQATAGYSINMSPTKWVEVVVCKDYISVNNNCDTINIGKTEIVANGVALNRYKKLRAILSIDSEQGNIQVETLEEIQTQ